MRVVTGESTELDDVIGV